MRARYKGISFDISPLFFVVTSLFLILDKSGLMSASLLASTLHESAHITTMILLKSAPLSISVKCYGLEIKSPSCAKKQAILIALAGPFANLIVFAICEFLYIIYRAEFLMYFSYINLAIALFNLLPISSLDGGDVVCEVTSFFFDDKTAKSITRIMSVIISLLLLILGVLLAFKGNFSILLIGVFLFILNLINNN